MKPSAHRIASAMPLGYPWTMYVIDVPNARPSPRSSFTFSGMMSPRITPMSVIPATRKSSRQYRMFGLFASGMSCFGPVCVRGRSRVPWPPERMSPFIRSRLEPHGGLELFEAALGPHLLEARRCVEHRDPVVRRARVPEGRVAGPRSPVGEFRRRHGRNRGGVEIERRRETGRELEAAQPVGAGEVIDSTLPQREESEHGVREAVRPCRGPDPVRDDPNGLSIPEGGEKPRREVQAGVVPPVDDAWPDDLVR